jgi:hypothetical protein
MLTAQAAGTQIKLFRFPIKHNSSWLNIRQPASSGMLFRVAYPITEVYCFATYIALCSQMIDSFFTNLQVALDNRSRIIPQFADYTKERR